MSIEPNTHTANQFTALIHDKAWELLGLTGVEFLRAWYAGDFAADDRPPAVAMSLLMTTGQWTAPGPTEATQLISSSPMVAPTGGRAAC